jgi:uncharacterized protein (UPF0264 family)
MARLLISVRSPAEARIALAAGTHVIDVKEPRAGSLGRAGDRVILQVVQLVNGRCAVSAALGEMLDNEPVPLADLQFVKWGLAGCARITDWRRQLALKAELLKNSMPACLPVAVAYADWRDANSPPPDLVSDFAVEHNWPVVLLDTWRKGQTLLERLAVQQVVAFCGRCHRRGLKIALAGSLDNDAIDLLRDVPDWFAVRGAVCRRGVRAARIDRLRVRDLVARLDRAPRPAMCVD